MLRMNPPIVMTMAGMKWYHVNSVILSRWRHEIRKFINIRYIHVQEEEDERIALKKKEHQTGVATCRGGGDVSSAKERALSHELG